MARLGVMHYQLDVPGNAGKVSSEPFFAVRRTSFPVGMEDNVLIVGDTNNSHRVVSIASLGPKKGQEFAKLVKEGKLQMLELYEPADRPLASFGNTGDKWVRYVLAKNVSSKELPWEIVPRRGGGHWQLDYPHYIRQAIVTPERINATRTAPARFYHRYEGDRTAMPILVREMGQDIANKWNATVKLMDEGNMAGAKQLFQNSGMPWSGLSSLDGLDRPR